MVQRASQTSVPTGIEGIDIPPAVFADRLAFIEAAKSGLSGEVIRQAVDVVGHRDLFVRLLGDHIGQSESAVPSQNSWKSSVRGTP